MAIASDMAPEAIEVEEHSADEKHEKNTDEKQNSDEERDDDKQPVIVDVVEGVVQDLDEENETNGGKGEKRSKGDVASAEGDRDPKREDRDGRRRCRSGRW